MIIAIDVDGTLLTTTKKILPETIDALNTAQSKGHIVILVTGRSLNGIKEYIDILGLTKFVVVNNGATIYNIKDKKFHSCPTLDHDIVYDFIDVAKETSSFVSVHEKDATHRCFFGQKKTKEVLDDEINSWTEVLKPEVFMQKIKKCHPLQVSMKISNDLIQEYAKKFKEKYFGRYQVVISGSRYIDVNYKKVSKLEALKWILNKEGMTLKDTVAIGDSGNDVDMIKGAGLGIAMANGTPEIIAVANEVIGNNDTQSIAKKIWELIAESGNKE